MRVTSYRNTYIYKKVFSKGIYVKNLNIKKKTQDTTLIDLFKIQTENHIVAITNESIRNKNWGTVLRDGVDRSILNSHNDNIDNVLIKNCVVSF